MGLFGLLTGKKKLSASEKEFVRRQEKILADCIRICSETDNIKTFFSRYSLAEKSAKMIAQAVGEDVKCLGGNSVSAKGCLEMLENEKCAYTNNMLTRYIQKETVHILGLSRGQIKKANGIAAIIEEYADDMPFKSLELGRELSAKMIKKVERAVNA